MEYKWKMETNLGAPLKEAGSRTEEDGPSRGVWIWMTTYSLLQVGAAEPIRRSYNWRRWRWSQEDYGHRWQYLPSFPRLQLRWTRSWGFHHLGEEYVMNFGAIYSRGPLLLYSFRFPHFFKFFIPCQITQIKNAIKHDVKLYCKTSLIVNSGPSPNLFVKS